MDFSYNVTQTLCSRQFTAELASERLLPAKSFAVFCFQAVWVDGPRTQLGLRDGKTSSDRKNDKVAVGLGLVGAGV